MSKLSDFINAEQGFLVKLRCENRFDEGAYREIEEEIRKALPEWKAQGYVRSQDVEALIGLIEQLAGGSRFFDEETAEKAEDACEEIVEILGELAE